jgi:hypothetical protein
LVLLLTYGFQRPLTPGVLESVALPKATPGPRANFVPMRRRVMRRLLLTAAIVSAAAILAVALLIF